MSGQEGIYRVGVEAHYDGNNSFCLTTSDVNFTNVFCAPFLHEIWCQKFQTQNTALIWNFGTKNALSYEKGARKTLMKLTPEVNFTNI